MLRKLPLAYTYYSLIGYVTALFMAAYMADGRMWRCRQDKASTL